ncbi:MAG: FtsX-like permease family protein [Steroidobacteraceae bacterium]
MSPLGKKLLRDLARHRAQAIAIALVVAIGTSIQVASSGLLASLSGARDGFYREQRFAEVFASLVRAPERLAGQLARIEGVKDVQTRVRLGGLLDDPRLGEPGSVMLVSWPATGLNGVTLSAGRAPRPGHNELVIGSAFAAAHGLQPGHPLRLIARGQRLEARIVGIGDSPEFVYAIGPGELLPDYRRHALGWMEHTELAALAGLTGAFNDVSLSLHPAGDPAALEATVIDELDRLLAPYGGAGAYGRDEQLSHRFIENEFDELRVHATVVPLIFLGAAAFLLHLVLTRRVRREREIIGMLKAFGFGNGAIALHYLSLGLAIYAAGALAGLAGGIWLGQMLSGLYLDFFRFPEFGFTLDPARTLLGLAIAGAAVATGTLAGLLEAMRLPPAEAMRPPTPPLYRHRLRWPSAWTRRVGVPERMILRHLARAPLRSALSVLGLAIACGLVTFSGFQQDAIHFLTTFHFERQNRADLTVTFVEPRSGRVAQELARQPGVLAVQGHRTLPVKLVHGHASYRTALEAWQAQPALRRLLDQAGQEVSLPAGGLLLSRELGKMLGVRVGDRLRVEVLEGDRRSLDMRVAALLEDYVGVGAYLPLDFLHRQLDEQDALSGAWLSVEPGRSTPLVESLSRLPGVAAVTVNARRSEAFNETFGRSLMIVAAVFLAVAGTLAFAMIFNAARTLFDERRRELATLRVIGLTRAETGYLLAAELLLLALLALPVGLVLGYLLADLLATAMRSELFRLPVILERESYARGAILLLAATAVSVGWSLRDLWKLDVKEALSARD